LVFSRDSIVAWNDAPSNFRNGSGIGPPVAWHFFRYCYLSDWRADAPEGTEPYLVVLLCRVCARALGGMVNHDASRRGSGFFLLSANPRSNLWKLGGIAVSHLADIPIILSGSGVGDMLPVGRFLC
jgi:hypothetical protein